MKSIYRRSTAIEAQALEVDIKDGILSIEDLTYENGDKSTRITAEGLENCPVTGNYEYVIRLENGKFDYICKRETSSSHHFVLGGKGESFPWTGLRDEESNSTLVYGEMQFMQNMRNIFYLEGRDSFTFPWEEK